MVLPCETFVGTYALGPVTLNTLSSCDPWAVPHLVNPFLFGITTKSVPYAFLLSGIGELIEYLMLSLYNSFIVFLGTHDGVDFNVDVENLAGSYIEDWLIQGGLGTLMAWVFYNHFVFPQLIRFGDVLKGGALRVLFYLFFIVCGCIVLPSALFGIEVNGFPLGRHLYYIIQSVMFLLIILLQPRDVFQGYKKMDIYQFWFCSWFIMFVYLLQNSWDWFYSSHIQSWLITGIFLVIVFFWSIYRWRWPWRIEMDMNFYWTKKVK